MNLLQKMQNEKPEMKEFEIRITVFKDRYSDEVVDTDLITVFSYDVESIADRIVLWASQNGYNYDRQVDWVVA